MSLSTHQLGLVLIYFVYGLSFFVMGIALTLEASWSRALAERRVVRPLAIFGLLHGSHEWVEVIMLQGIWLGTPFPEPLRLARVAFLAISFIPLITFAIVNFFPNLRIGALHFSILAGFSMICLLLSLTYYQDAPSIWIDRIDALDRYLLAVPGAILAGFALRKRARSEIQAGRHLLAQVFKWGGAGFFLYGASQVFVAPADFFPANLINSTLFTSTFGFPIQIVRTIAALLITTGMIRAIQYVEREGEEKLVAAQKERLEALQQVQEELIQRETMRVELLRHIVMAQEDERKRISRELHDETAQMLTAFSLNLATLQANLGKNPEVKDLVSRLQTLSRKMSQSIYRMVHDLRPSQLDDLGLVPTLQYLVEESQKSMKIQVTLEVDGPRRRLDPLVETVIFRVAQEAIANVKRHAQVNQAKIRIIFDPEETILQVQDEGKGFDPSQELVPPHGWGLAGMRERVESVCGHLVIESTPGQGTFIEVTIPDGCDEIARLEEELDGKANPVNVSG